MQVDLSQDYLYVDNTEDVNYTSVRRTGNLTTTLTIKRRSLSQRELFASAGAYAAKDATFIIFQATIPPGLVPKPADLIEDVDSILFKVIEVEPGKRDSNGAYQTLKCKSRNLTINEDLKSVIDIQQPTITYTPALTKKWPEDGQGKTLYQSLACKVQLITEELVEERGIVGFNGTHAVILSQQVNFDSSWMENRIKFYKDTATVIYLEITGYRQPNLITELPIIDARIAV